MAIHTDHKGVELKPEEVEAYWKGFVQGVDSVKPKKITSFKDETGFELFLKSMGWELVDCNYKTDYFTSYGTILRLYKLGSNRITIGLTDKGVKVLNPVFMELPLPWSYEKALKELI